MTLTLEAPAEAAAEDVSAVAPPATSPKSEQPAPTIAEQIVGALTRAWQAIQAKHPEVPDVVLTFGSGTMNAKAARHGHFAGARWKTKNGETFAELFVAGESFERGAGPTLGTLIHEAAHGACLTLGVSDTSQNGRYHNKKFKAQAEAMGLVIELAPTIGYSVTTLPPSTAAAYRPVIEELENTLTAYRHAEVHGTAKPRNNNYVKCECECLPPIVIRVSKTALASATIACVGEDGCGKPFVSVEAGDEDQD